ncbi:MAG: hypothetical protein BWY89_01619 [Bacteroidetes bacterium ADurb.BinA012]|nr:MAG: hypothetical protein BWY89_01619 [Bacteroidetes bacterium ADurb.BinA012]
MEPDNSKPLVFKIRKVPASGCTSDLSLHPRWRCGFYCSVGVYYRIAGCGFPQEKQPVSLGIQIAVILKAVLPSAIMILCDQMRAEGGDSTPAVHPPGNASIEFFHKGFPDGSRHGLPCVFHVGRGEPGKRLQTLTVEIYHAVVTAFQPVDFLKYSISFPGSDAMLPTGALLSRSA